MMRLLRSLQARLWLSLSLIIVATLLFLGVAFGAQSRRVGEALLYTRLEEQARAIMSLVVQRSRNAPSPDAFDNVFPLPPNKAPGRPRVLLLRPDGTVVFDTVRTPTERLVGTTLPVWHHYRARIGRLDTFRGAFRDARGKRWLVAGYRFPRPVDGDPLILAVAAPADERRSLVQVWQPLGVSAVVALLAGLIVALFVTRWLGRPIRQLSQATRAIAEGNLDVRMDPEDVPTEFVPLVASFNSMVEEVQRSRQAQRNFVANVSHDLKTPLTSIRGFAQALKEGVAADPQMQKRAAEVIYDEAERMHRLVTQLLELAKLDAGQLPLAREDVNLSNLLARLVDSVRLRAEQAGIHLETAIAPDLYVVGDPDRLAQVFSNLLDNALTYTPHGGTVRVEARVATGDGEWVVVDVTDTGPGIPEEDQPYVFERFYRVDKARSRGQGSGLGLAIVKELVDAHQGRVSVQSVEGLGTRFTVRLPRRPA